MIRTLTTLALLMVLVATPCAAPLVYAVSAEDQFEVSQVVTSSPDIIAPSVPTGLVATAVSSTQINLSWNASTDNASVAGYRVFRDSVFIATSTSLVYIDTGLTPSTLYTYTVSAFDPSFNESAQSAPASATTLDATQPPPPIDQGNPSFSGNGSSGWPVLQLTYFLVSPSTNSVTIDFGTNIPVWVTTQWGLTTDYEGGSVTGAGYLSQHSIVLNGLSPATNYYFTLTLRDMYGRIHTIPVQMVRTLGVGDVIPANVSQFVARSQDEAIALSWKNPRSPFEKVRIVRSTAFFPTDPFGGEVVYEGVDTRTIDTNVVSGEVYYYTAFTILNDRYSSGAMAQARLLRPGEQPDRQDFFAGILELPKDLIHPLIQAFTFGKLRFEQDGVELPVFDDMVEVRADREVRISIAYDELPEILKTITITLYDPYDQSKSFSFLLRVNKEKTAYEALMAPLERPGTYKFGLAILDHKHQGLKKLTGIIEATIPGILFAQAFVTKTFLYTVFLIIFLILVILIVLWLRRSQKNNEASF